MTAKKLQSACIVVLCLLLSCNSNTTEVKSPQKENRPLTQENSGMVKTLCFENVSGNKNRDTSMVRLEIKEGEVTGLYSWLPYQKDQRRGTFKGTLNGNIIRATWAFMQEGIADSLPLEFRLTRNKLLQKEYSVNPTTGRQFISDTSAFSIEFSLSACR